jgi:hypothetical protein
MNKRPGLVGFTNPASANMTNTMADSMVGYQGQIECVIRQIVSAMVGVCGIDPCPLNVLGSSLDPNAVERLERMQGSPTTLSLILRPILRQSGQHI